MLFKKLLEKKYTNQDGTTTDDPYVAAVSYCDSRIEKLENTINLLRFTGSFDMNKISFKKRNLSWSIDSSNNHLIVICRPQIEYVSNHFIVKTIEPDKTLVMDEYSSKDIKWYEVLYNDINKALICFYEDDKPIYWFVLDKTKDTLIQIPDPNLFIKGAESNVEA